MLCPEKHGGCERAAGWLVCVFIDSVLKALAGMGWAPSLRGVLFLVYFNVCFMICKHIFQKNPPMPYPELQGLLTAGAQKKGRQVWGNSPARVGGV
jgi:hypothetical protein